MTECEFCGAYEGDFIKLLNVRYDYQEPPRKRMSDKYLCCRCFLEGSDGRHYVKPEGLE